MIYLSEFQFLDEDEHYVDMCKCIYNLYTPDEYYPFGLFNQNFSSQGIKQIDFEDITIIYGGNGSGKTTLLNIMAEKIDAFRHKKYLQTKAFTFYLHYCYYKYDEKPLSKKFLASDDIFDHILTIRDENLSVKKNKIEETDFFHDAHDYQKTFPTGIKLNLEDENDDERLKFARFVEARKKTRRQFVRSRAGEMQRQFSNGENALMFFDKEIEKDSLYLLDEPENSLSPKFQIELKTLIEDSVKYKNCQFIIATHSPFLLSLKNAKIYNLDATPVTVEHWYELENVRYYYDFFKMNQLFFE